MKKSVAFSIILLNPCFLHSFDCVNGSVLSGQLSSYMLQKLKPAFNSNLPGSFWVSGFFFGHRPNFLNDRKILRQFRP